MLVTNRWLLRVGMRFGISRITDTEHSRLIELKDPVAEQLPRPVLAIGGRNCFTRPLSTISEIQTKTQNIKMGAHEIKQKPRI